MGYLDKARTRGGFLNDHDGEIQDVTFKIGRIDGSKCAPNEAVPLWAVFTIQEDGRNEPTIQHFKVAGKDADVNWKLSKDKKTAEALNDNATVWVTNDGVSMLFASMVDTAGMDEGLFPDLSVASDLNFTFLEGQRFHFIQVKREDDYALKHRRKDKKDPSKDYALTYTAVSRQLGDETASKPNGKANGKAAHDDAEEVIAAKAEKTLVAILKKAKGGTLPYKGLKLALTTALMGDRDRNAVTAYALDPEHLATIDGIAYDDDARTLELA